MKKRIAILLAALMLLSFAACNMTPAEAKDAFIDAFFGRNNRESQQTERPTLPPYTEPSVTEPLYVEPAAPEPPVMTEPPHYEQSVSIQPPAAEQATPIPSTFVFGGAVLPAGITTINKETTDPYGNKVCGTQMQPKRITREEVESLVALCPNLRQLELDYCYLDDYEPLGRLTRLTNLSLMTCGNNYGGIKLTDIDWVASLKELRTLNLCHNYISDISAISGLVHLEYLNLADNDLRDDDLWYLTGLTSLTELDLYQLPYLTDVSPLAYLTSLYYLHLGQDGKISNVSALAGLPNLTQLRLNATGIKDFDDFGRFRKLECLDISRLSCDTDRYYALMACPNLWAVVLSDMPYDVLNVISDLNLYYGMDITVFEKWSDITQRPSGTTNIWNAIDRAGLDRYLGRTYNSIRSDLGPLDYADYNGEDFFLRFCFRQTNIRFSFDIGMDVLPLDNDWSITGNDAEYYINGTERCNGIESYPISQYGFSGTVYASEIGASVNRYGNAEDEWYAETTRNGYRYCFSCDRNGKITGSSTIWILDR